MRMSSHCLWLIVLLAYVVSFGLANGQPGIQLPRDNSGAAQNDEVMKELVHFRKELADELKDLGERIAALEKARSAPTPGRGPASAIPEPMSATQAAELLTGDQDLVAATKAEMLARSKRELEKFGEIKRELFYYNWEGRIMFLAVHGLLLSAMWMAWREFNAAARVRQSAATTQQELNLSLQGIAIKTSLQGVLIMGFALAFYFLYLKFVYPLTTVSG